MAVMQGLYQLRESLQRKKISSHQHTALPSLDFCSTSHSTFVCPSRQFAQLVWSTTGITARLDLESCSSVPFVRPVTLFDWFNNWSFRKLFLCPLCPSSVTLSDSQPRQLLNYERVCREQFLLHLSVFYLFLINSHSNNCATKRLFFSLLVFVWSTATAATALQKGYFSPPVVLFLSLALEFLTAWNETSNPISREALSLSSFFHWKFQTHRCENKKYVKDELTTTTTTTTMMTTTIMATMKTTMTTTVKATKSRRATDQMIAKEVEQMRDGWSFPPSNASWRTLGVLVFVKFLYIPASMVRN